MIYFNDHNEKAQQDKPSKIEKSVSQNNLIKFPLSHSDSSMAGLSINEKVGILVDKLLREDSLGTDHHKVPDMTETRDDPTYKLAEILLRNGIV